MVTYLESQATVGVTIIPAAGPEGHIFVVYYWIEGMAGWENLEAYPTPAKDGDEIYLAVGWINDGSSAAVGNIWAQLTAPDYHVYTPNAVENQDRSANPHSGYVVQFAPVTLNHSGSWKFFGMLSLDGVEWIDWKQYTFVVQEAPVGIPTTLTLSAPDSAGIGEKFNISGILYETESGIAIPNQPINLSYNGKSLGGPTTGIDGIYLKEVSISESGTWNLKSEFPGTTGYADSGASAGVSVAAMPLSLALLIAGPLVTGVALYVAAETMG